ncbi:trehalose monomycolate exporter MmpL3 [Mycolicibacterium sphagni]|uniref:MMPL family transporter n=1 Tax=Mycolicibacterium sphagni TaxID=1786 RepID=UPI0021F34E10|nr:MMPL family transporter [Mycolicibacterium sphagni]MCV7177693.1 MMPL family transporter [Mycolicibacterium sphagni]
MFAWWGRTVYRYRYIVIAVMVSLCLGAGFFGLSLGKHVTQSGFYDDNSQSVKASVLADKVYGRDRSSHIVAIFTAPKGKTVDDPEWSKKIVDELNQVVADHPDQMLPWAGYLKAPTLPAVQKLATDDKTRTFVTLPLKGDDDDTILNNFKVVQPDLQKMDDGKVELAGLQPVANELTGTIGKDQQRAEVLALPLVAVVLFFVFGGVVAACLPAMVGGLSILGSLGIMRLISLFAPVHFFAQPVVTLIGLGIAIDYGLFVVSRFREELAEGYDTESAIRRTVMTAGRTVTFSAVLIVASLAGLLLFPQGFLKSLTYAGIASVMLAAILSISVLPAVLSILGPNVDALGVRTLLRVPFFRNWKPMRVYLEWLANKLQKTQTREQVEKGFWGKLVNMVMKRPIMFALPIVVIMILLIIPLGKLSLGGFSEKYLPPTNSVRMAQEDFDRTFPGFRTEQMTLVIQNATPPQIEQITQQANAITGFTGQWTPRTATDEGTKDPNVTVIQNGLQVRNDAPKKISELRAIPPPKGVTIWVGGTPALEQDSIHSLLDKGPLMVLILISTTTILMFLAFGSLVLPIKAALMSALTLGSTMGVLTWIFVDGHGSSFLNFTATPLTAPVIGLIIAVIYGLSTDYEVFLVSRMVEARERGMSTTEAIRIGTATTGRIITAAALVLIVVAGAFAFSDLVMMKYLAFGLITALLLDATVIRMFLVPAVMKLLGDDCWWAPRWMKRLQVKLGLGEIHLPDERKRPIVRESDDALVGAGAPVATTRRPAHDPTHPGIEGRAMPRVVGRGEQRTPPPQDPPSAAGTTRMPDAGAGPDPGPVNEAPTTRFSVAKNAVKNAVNTATSAARTNRPPAAPAPDREIESWLGELRGSASSPTPPAAPQPSAEPTGAITPPEDATTAIPTQREQKGTDEVPPSVSAEETRAIPVSRPEQGDSEVATEKLNSRGKKEGEDRPRRGGGGGVSAAELLRREGRL